MMTITCPLTDAELRQADAATRHWYWRVLHLMNTTGCTFAMAAAAINAADRK